jgi:2-polyprenyl-6-methoxyphenol hydroxylase-like FAD-dependent oxidoreductase
LNALGIEATVFESAASIRALGVGISVLPHGTRELIDLGLGPALAATGIETRELKYLSKYGREISSDPRGLAAGFKWPQYGIHRASLHTILRDAVEERLAPDAIRTGHHVHAFAQDEHGVTAYFRDRRSGADLPPAHGQLLIGADGIHSRVRAVLYPDEGPPVFSGMMMWRGVHETAPFLDGRTMLIAGHWDLKAVVNVVSREAALRGRSLIAWVAEVRVAEAQPWRPGDWTRRGEKADFVRHFADWHFDAIDYPGPPRAHRARVRVPDDRPRSAAAVECWSSDAAG